MILTGIITGFTVAIVLLLVLGVMFYVVKRKIANIFRGFFESPNKDVASPFAVLVATIAQTFGTEISQSLKATFMGVQSVESRNNRKAEIAAAAGSNPLLGVILQAFPALGKRLSGPVVSALASSLLAGKPPDNHNHGSDIQSPFKF